MSVITLLNQKGGVGKTSTCHHLAGALVAMGRKVLLVDNDPQASLTQGFFGQGQTYSLTSDRTIESIYNGDEPFPSEVICSSGVAGIDLLPASGRATKFNMPLPYEEPVEQQTCLREFLAEVRNNYDLIFLDCPPNLHMCSWAALVASDALVVPLKPEDYGAQGITSVDESVDMVRSTFNPNLTMLGYLLTMVGLRKSIHQVYEYGLREKFNELVFSTRVTEAVDFVEALNRRLPVTQYKGKSASAKIMKALAIELETRLLQSAKHTSEAA